MFVWVSLLLRAVKYYYSSFQNKGAHKVSWPLFHISTDTCTKCLELTKL